MYEKKLDFNAMITLIETYGHHKYYIGTIYTSNIQDLHI